MVKADLHCHSTCSDGTNTPEELVQMAVEKELQGLSITDHDGIDAYKTVLPIAEEAGIKLLTGVEFSCVHRNCSVHVLCYGFHPESQVIREFCELHRVRRQERSRSILGLLAQQEVFIEESEIDNPMIGRPHIAQAMVDKGYVKSIQKAFDGYLKEGACAYVPSSTGTVEETLQLIKKARGKAVIAHPMLIKKNRVFKELLEMPFDGMEVHYARFRANQEAPYLRIAQERKLLVTGGSDYHGTVKPRAYLGSSWCPEESFQELWGHYQEVSGGGVPK